MHFAHHSKIYKKGNPMSDSITVSDNVGKPAQDELKLRIEDLYYTQKKSLKAIAAELKISASKLKKLFAQYGLVKKSPNNVTKKTLEDLYYTKKTPVKTIADQLEISTASLYKLFVKLGIKKRPNSTKTKTTIDLLSPNAVELLKTFYYDEKLSYKEIGNRFNISPSKVYNLIKKHGFEERESVLRKVKENISKNELIRMYSLENKSLREISDFYQTSPRKIKKLLIHYGISENPKLVKRASLHSDKDLLVKLYIEEDKTAAAVARELGVSLHILRQALKFHGLETKPVPSKNRHLDKDEVAKFYLEEGLSLVELSAKFNMRYITMARFLRKHNIRKLGVKGDANNSMENKHTEQEI